jgi:predicted RNA-binding protein with PUA-like domain
MKVGDLVLFYHSNADPPAVVGLARVSGAARPDPLQFDPSSHYHDPGSPPADPRWFLVDIAFVEKFPAEVGLPTLRSDPTLADMQVARNFRTSVQPVDPAHVLRVAELARATRVRDLLGAA